MRHVERTFDPVLIKAALLEDGLYEAFTDDYNPSFENFWPHTNLICGGMPYIKTGD